MCNVALKFLKKQFQFIFKDLYFFIIINRSLVTQCINRGHVIKVDHCNRYEMQSNISYFSSGLQVGMDQDLNNEIVSLFFYKSIFLNTWKNNDALVLMLIKLISFIYSLDD